MCAQERPASRANVEASIMQDSELDNIKLTERQFSLKVLSHEKWFPVPFTCVGFHSFIYLSFDCHGWNTVIPTSNLVLLA